MIKTDSTYLFEIPYKTVKGEDGKAAITLIIDYARNTFSVMPFTGDKHFTFANGKYTYPVWQAAIEAMKQAVNFAVNELKLVPEEKEEKRGLC